VKVRVGGGGVAERKVESKKAFQIKEEEERKTEKLEQFIN